MTGRKGSCSLYVHVPFCTKKCPYCHFFVLKDTPEGQDLFFQALCREWKQRQQELSDLELVSIYLGGGTPSLLSPSRIEEFLIQVASSMSLSPDCEITLEANPERVTLINMQAFAKAGVNRISLGVQSFDDGLLQRLGRTHGSLSAKKAVENTYASGIANISIDLLYEVPGQSVKQFEESLAQACLLPIKHLSLYNLVLEPGTPFHRQRKILLPILPSEEDSLTMLHQAVAILKEGGFTRYEISAFAKEGKVSQHNVGYWTARPFLGLGPSAFSYLQGRRTQNMSHLRKWAEAVQAGQNPEGFAEELGPYARQKELLAVELRMLGGVDLTGFVKKQGTLHEDLTQAIAHLIKRGLLQRVQNILTLTEEGKLFYDTVATELM
ncbi:MAG: radical SAM family heme chaperone HemW [Chlamydiae bacterium]|nr:radical SAM family heme chaperone HemW [Chlamydiota bacterium]